MPTFISLSFSLSRAGIEVFFFSVTFQIPAIDESKRENKAGTFVTGVDIFSKDAKEKIDERAKRFGISKEAAERSIVEEAENLYER